jgi:hypothetical protein
MSENSNLQQQDTVFEVVIGFLQNIGIPVYFQPIATTCFLPGLEIQNGALYIDRDKLTYPGDILHEAGHIAVVPAAERVDLNADAIAKRPHREAEEMMAIAWSYAVTVYLNIDASFVFHDDGYKGGGSGIAENFKNGQYFGVPMLQWVGMTYERPDPEDPNRPIYPQMLHWLRN